MGAIRHVYKNYLGGSVLGPVLFSIFISPMFNLFNACSYTEDSYLTESGGDIEAKYVKE